ncbi:hypothetical protein Q6264_28360, partial [Klebsiella pneumoniae]
HTVPASMASRSVSDIGGRTFWNQTGTCTALAAVEFQAQEADSIHTNANGALGKARLIEGVKAQAGFFGAALSLTVDGTVTASGFVTDVTAEI